MDALSQAILGLLKRQDQSDRRLARIEQALGIAPLEPATEPKAPEAPPAVAQPVPPPPPSASARQLETRMGLTWINRVGVVTFVLGVAFFFKYAVEQHWIGEMGRVVLGVAAGVAALVVADRIWHGGQKIFAQ